MTPPAPTSEVRRLHEAVRSLEIALETRDVIGQAKGILMERFRLTADGAFAVLRQQSQQLNEKLRTVAERIAETGECARNGRRREMAQAVAQRTVGDVTIPEAGHYTIDPAHSTIEFVVRHLGLAKVRGRFNEFEGAFEVGEDPFASHASVTIQAASIDTRDPDRDAHLRSADFLDVEHHPTIDFRSTRVRREHDEWLLDGDLTVRGVTRSTTVHLEFEGGARDPWGGIRIAFSAWAQVNREEFGLTWNQALEAGGWLVGKQVRIEVSVEAVRQERDN